MERKKTLLTLTAFGAGVAATVGFLYVKEKARFESETPAGTCFDSEKRVPIFQINGKEFTLDDLPKDVQQPFLLAQMDAYRRTNEIVEELAVRSSLATREGIPDGSEVFSSLMATDAEIETYYKLNFGNGKNAAELSLVKEAIRDSLNQQKILSFVTERIPKLRTEKSFRNLVEIPCGPKKNIEHKEISFTIEESKGPLEVIFFSDFTSPRVRQLISPLSQFAKENGEKITLREIYLFDQAESDGDVLAKLSYCVRQKDAKLFPAFRVASYTIHTPRSAKNAKPDHSFLNLFLDLAKAVGLKEDEIQVCLKSKELQNFVNLSKRAANQAGVTAAPAFFVRNRMLALPASSDPVTTLSELVRNFKQ